MRYVELVIFWLPEAIWMNYTCVTGLHYHFKSVVKIGTGFPYINQPGRLCQHVRSIFAQIWSVFGFLYQKKHTCLSVPLFDPRPNTWAIQSILVKIRDFSWIIPPGFEWIHEMPLNQAVFHRIAPQVSLHTSGSNTGSVVGKLWIGDTGDTSIIFRLNMDEVTPFKQLVISGYIPLLISNQSTSKPHIWSLESLQPWFNHHWTITEP